MFKPCPYCGILFSGKFGVEKRNEYRIRKEIPVSFSKEGKPLEADILNCSGKGFGLQIAGFPSISEGDEVDCTVGAANVKAEVKWFSASPDSAHSFAGLQMKDINPDILKF